MKASPLELLWTVIALCGLAFSGWLAVDGWRDWRTVQSAIVAVPPRARAWGPRWWVALSATIANLLLCLVWLGFAAVGALAMRYPPPRRRRPLSNVFAWLLIVMEAVLMAVQAWHLYVRHRVNHAARFGGGGR